MRTSRRSPRRSRLLAAALLAGALLVSGGSAAIAGDKPGKGKGPGKKGTEKVTLCHKGHTITVAKPAVKAHLAHGDTLGACRPAVPGHATITVVKRVVNDNGGTKTAADFTLTISGPTAVGGNSFAGSASGVTKTLTTVGAYSVTEAGLPGYRQTASSGCSGTIATGESKTCTITNDDVAARITVVKHVINDDGGTKTAADFTITITGVTAVGGNTMTGSPAGVTKTLATVGPYGVTEAVLPGYVLKSASAACSGTIALGQHKLCVLVNDDVHG